MASTTAFVLRSLHVDVCEISPETGIGVVRRRAAARCDIGSHKRAITIDDEEACILSGPFDITENWNPSVMPSRHCLLMRRDEPTSESAAVKQRIVVSTYRSFNSACHDVSQTDAPYRNVEMLKPSR